ncbi:MAG: M20 family peptidase [Desulfobacteraceae bacterium]|nr:MAG: M20 family peptidase [Desulfobacteraceae bacterium]
MTSQNKSFRPQSKVPDLPDLIDLTQTLIRFKTMHSRLDQIHDCINHIASILEAHDIEFRHMVNSGSPSILVTPGTHEFPLLLMSHIDVVDAPDALFEPRMVNGRLYGRGSYDDKYAAALSIVLLLKRMIQLRQAGKHQTDLKMGILITSDEEIGGINGAQEVLRSIRPEFSIILDGGSINEVITKEKGIARVRLIAAGQSCHASRPWLGKNAIEMVMSDYAKLRRHFKTQQDTHWHPTVNPGLITGGKIINQVPDHCELCLDIRYTEHDDIQALLDRIEKETDSELKVDLVEPVFISPPSDYLSQIKALSKDIKLGYEHGASDARHLMPHHLAGVVWGPNGNLTQHSLDEHVEIDSLYLLHERLSRFIDQL